MKKEKHGFTLALHIRGVFFHRLHRGRSGVRAARKGRRNAYSHPSSRKISSSESQD